MTRRTHLAYALAWASIRDGVALVVTGVRFVAVEPALCRVRGHKPRALFTQDGARVTVLCVRCGTTTPED